MACTILSITTLYTGNSWHYSCWFTRSLRDTCLLVTESFIPPVSSQRFVNDKLVSCKPPKCLYTLIRPHLIDLLANAHAYHNSKEYWGMLYNEFHKINPSGPFGHFLFYVMPSHFLLVGGIQHCSALKCHHYPTILCGPFWINQDFSSRLSACFNCKYFPICTRELLHVGCLLGLSKTPTQAKTKKERYITEGTKLYTL